MKTTLKSKGLCIIITLALCIFCGFVCFGAKSAKSTKSAKSAKPAISSQEEFAKALNLMENKFYLQAIKTLTPLIANSPAPEMKGKYLYLRATCYKQTKNWQKAISDYKMAIKEDGFPFADLAKLNIASVYESLKDTRSAIEWYQAVIRDHPCSLAVMDAQYQIGDLYFDKKEYESAITHYTKFATSYPDGGRARIVIYKKGEAYRELKKWPEAYSQYYKLIYQNKPDWIAPIAVEKMESLLSSHPEIPVTREARMVIADALLGNKKHTAARNHLKKVIAGADDLSVEAAYKTADSYFREGKYTTAVAEYKAFEKRYPEGTYAVNSQYQVALCMLKLGKISDFRNMMAKFAASNPQSELADDAEFKIAEYYYEKGRCKEATEAYIKAVDKYPASDLAAEALWNTGSCNFNLKNNDLSYQAFKRLSTDYPKSPMAGTAGFWAGVAAEKLGKWQDAFDSYKLAMESGEKYYSVRAKKRAETLIKNRKVNEDIASLQTEQYRRVKIDESIPAWQNIANHHSSARTKELIDLKLYDDVINQSLAAIDSGMYLEFAHYNLSICYAKIGEYSKSWSYAWRLSELPGIRGENGAMPRELYQMLYPIAHKDTIFEKSEENKLDPYLVKAVIFEESRYNHSAKSRAGACGLMQIMPSTGLDIARRLSISSYKKDALFSADTNIKMGTWYLKKLVDSLMEHVQDIYSAKPKSGLTQDHYEIASMLALGAYNGGEGRIRRWIERYGLNDIDEFVENITINETRNYIKKVYDSYEVYKCLYSENTEMNTNTQAN